MVDNERVFDAILCFIHYSCMFKIRSSIAENLSEKFTSLHKPEDHYLKANFMLCHSLLIIYVSE